MRKVMVSEYKLQQDKTWKLEEKGMAWFHAFGTNYEEFENGAVNFSTAIVEWGDGTVDNVSVERIRFVSEENDK